MFSFSKLVEDASDYFELVEVGLNVDFEFEQKDKVFLISDGSVLAYGEKDPQTGIKATRPLPKMIRLGLPKRSPGEACSFSSGS